MAVFRSRLGWFGLLGDQRSIILLTIGHRSASEVRDAIARSPVCDRRDDPPIEFDWNPELRSRLQQYAEGAPVCFDDVVVQHSGQTAFRRRVVAATRAIHYGETLTYGELAERAGAPFAARAVGRVMSSNRVPIIVPCHRVVAANGKLGGFSAPQGVSLKENMLAMEAGID